MITRGFRSKIGIPFGARRLLLEHTGRQSGLRCEATLHVLARPAREVYLVAAALGDRADWFRNVMANPYVRVSVPARQPRLAYARRLPRVEAELVLADCAGRRSRSWPLKKAMQTTTSGLPLRERGTSMSIVELRLIPREECAAAQWAARQRRALSRKGQ